MPTKEEIIAELTTDYRETVRRTAEEERRSRNAGRGRRTRSVRVAYMLWGLLGGFGAHRFYLGHIRSGAAMLMLASITSALSYAAPESYGYGLPVLALGWWLVDAFLIPGMMAPEDVA